MASMVITIIVIASTNRAAATKQQLIIIKHYYLLFLFAILAQEGCSFGSSVTRMCPGNIAVVAKLITMAQNQNPYQNTKIPKYQFFWTSFLVLNQFGKIPVFWSPSNQFFGSKQSDFGSKEVRRTRKHRFFGILVEIPYQNTSFPSRNWFEGALTGILEPLGRRQTC